jgi:hypothetical protein
VVFADLGDPGYRLIVGIVAGVELGETAAR